MKDIYEEWSKTCEMINGKSKCICYKNGKKIKCKNYKEPNAINLIFSTFGNLFSPPLLLKNKSRKLKTVKITKKNKQKTKRRK